MDRREAKMQYEMVGAWNEHCGEVSAPPSVRSIKVINSTASNRSFPRVSEPRMLYFLAPGAMVQMASGASILSASDSLTAKL
jgi:hypothetical protein